MGDRSDIEWTDATFNPWVGCTKVSSACDHCYAESWAKRSGHPELWTGDRRRTSETNWRQPIKWNRLASEERVRKRVFCASLADVFDNQVPENWRWDLWALIAKTPWLDWQLLTKRPQNIAKMLPCIEPLGLESDWPWPNVWIGTTAENQEEADRRIPILLATPAAVRFVSLEPLLGAIDLEHVGAPDDPQEGWTFSALTTGDYYTQRFERVLDPPVWDSGDGPYREHKLDWVIVGGESGPHARPMHPQWARDIRDQCKAAGVAFFFKQWGQHAPFYGEHSPDEPRMVRVGKRAAGRLLDGVEHNGMPEVRT